MSNHLAVATVTATLVRVLQDAATKGVPGTIASAARPGIGDTAPAKGIGIFLYHVVPNAAWRNRDLPTRDNGTPLKNRPRAALDLHYLFTFYGDEKDQEPQRLLGATVRAIHTRPTLTRQMLRDTVSSSIALVDSDLADQEELINFTPLPMSLEELSKLWSIFFQTPYSLSIAYQATVVLIDAEETPRTPRPVRRSSLRVVPFNHPFIEETLNISGDREPLRVGDVMVLRGRQLGGRFVGVRIGDSPQLFEPDSVTDSEVRVTLAANPPPPAPPLRAGVRVIQVVQRQNWGTDAQPDFRKTFESNGVPVVIRPVILQDAAGAWAALSPTVDPNGLPAQQVDVTVSPAVQDGQRFFVLLNEDGGRARAHEFPVTVTQPGAAISVIASGVAPGNYFLRVRVDRAESLLDIDPASPTFGPRVTFP